MAKQGSAKSAIVGLGLSELSRESIGSSRKLAADAVRDAIADAGLRPCDVDGLLINRSPLADPDSMPLTLQDDLQLANLRLLSGIEGQGSSAVQMIQYATGAIEAGMADTVVCVFADTPVQSQGGGQAFAAPLAISGIPGWEARCGLYGAPGAYALAADEYLSHYRLDRDCLGAVAVADRAWAMRNPQAFLRKPLDLLQYRASPWVVEPFRVLDCAYPVNGAVAVVVTSARRAPDLTERPAYVHGMGQGHAGSAAQAEAQGGLPPLGARLAGQIAYHMAGVEPGDIAACQFYEAFSITTLLGLEAYGFCEPGTAGAFVKAGETSPGGRLPCNTGGGHLSGYYLQGMTPLAEALIQIRRQGGERQLDNVALQLVTGNGGCLDYHAALLLGSEPRL